MGIMTGLADMTLGYMEGKMADATEEGEKKLYKFTNSDSPLKTMTKFVTYELRDDVHERRKYNHAFQEGYDKGSYDTVKKFAAELERNDNFRFAAFSLGMLIAKLSDEQEQKLNVIVDALGYPNSPLLKSYVSAEYDKITRERPTFYQIKEKYLKNLPSEDLILIDNFLKAVVEAGSYNASCSNFYSNDWKNYLRSRS